MRSVNFNKSNKNKSSWVLATLLMKKYLDTREKPSDLFDTITSKIDQNQLNHCKFLFYGALRNILRIETALKKLIKKQPKHLVLSIFLISGYELLGPSQNKKEKIIHHAVEEAKSLISAKEVKFINAVLRKLAFALDEQSPEKSLSIFYSHPQWLVQHWIKQFGNIKTEQLLKWNQQIPHLYLYSKHLPDTDKAELKNIRTDCYELPEKGIHHPGIKDLLNQGLAYIKDPATFNAVDALNPKPNESILDLCASPGGKTFDCIQRMKNQGTIVAVDLPNQRIERLNRNLSAYLKENSQLRIFPQDILSIKDETFAEAKLPTKYDGILLDAPCSNTGVIQRKPDIRWRLNYNDINQCAELQLKLLTQASHWVKPNGRIVYSTCSIDKIENDAVIEAFLKTQEGSSFHVIKKKVYYPWADQHDGAGVFLLNKMNV
jgi:16S rRNA (cytosine967-C5)-methyltransferase